MPTATQSNSMPPGGVTATQPITPAGNLTPADIQAITEALSPIQAQFRAQSTFLTVDLDQAVWNALGQQQSVKISNVGLGTTVITEWNVVITVANSSTSAAEFTVSPLFPYNLIANTNISINGGSAVYSCSGPSALAAMTRQRKGSRRLVTSGGFGPALDPSLVQITLGSNLTATNAAATAKSLSGIASISVAASASTNNTITVKFFTFEKLALDKDSLLGSLPLQNNSTFIQIQRSVVGSLKTTTRNDLVQPFYGTENVLTYTLTTCTADATYEFASVPANAALYQPMITNSYQTIEASNNTASATGSGALKYDIPKNIYLVAAHLIGQDSLGAVLQGYNSAGLGKLQLQYNAGSVVPVTQHAARSRARQFLTYDYDPTNFPGYRLWDGEDTSDDINASDNMGWLDAYYTASPQVVVDIGSTVSTPITYTVLREAVVSGAVQTVGG